MLQTEARRPRTTPPPVRSSEETARKHRVFRVIRVDHNPRGVALVPAPLVPGQCSGKAKGPRFDLGPFISLATTYSPAFNSTIGAVGLTSVFGMGTGVAPPLWSPGIYVDNELVQDRTNTPWECVLPGASWKRRGEVCERMPIA